MANTATQQDDFLPQDYEAPIGGGGYMKLQMGENRFRIISKPIIGWLDWKDKVPHRFLMNAKPEKPFDPKQSIKHFWSVIVLDRADASIKILEITQGGIQKAIQDLSKDEEWGAPFNYDIKISRKGEGLKTEYSVTPSPKKDLTPEEKQIALDRPINLPSLYKNEDPFAVSNGEQTQLCFQSLPF